MDRCHHEINRRAMARLLNVAAVSAVERNGEAVGPRPMNKMTPTA